MAKKNKNTQAFTPVDTKTENQEVNTVPGNGSDTAVPETSQGTEKLAPTPDKDKLVLPPVDVTENSPVVPGNTLESNQPPALDESTNEPIENDLDAFIDLNDKAVMPKATLPTEAELSPALKIVKDYLDTVSLAIPETAELIRLNSRLRDAIYLILNQENTEFAIQQLRQLVSMTVEKKSYVFDTSMTFQGLEKLRWTTGMRREYESILTTVAKMRKWVKEEEVGPHAWERLRADMRPVKSEQYARIILGAVGIEA